ncbi:MAG: dihydrodipicolinate synthase family protein [Planctomycetota bacterium]
MRIEGILPALLTPMDGSGKVNPTVLKSMVQWLFDRGVHGLYVCGTSGEGLLLSAEEREQVLEWAIEATAGRGKVIAHVGAISTMESVRLAKHAAKVGADAVSSIPPFTYGRNAHGMRAHYQAINDATELPLYLYNIPSLTAVNVTAAMVKPLLELKNIRGIKFSDPNLFAEFELVSIGKGFDVLHGYDETLLYSFMVGTVGGIGLTYNFMPSLFVELYRSFKNGEWQRANELQLKASRMIDCFLKHAGKSPVGYAKGLMGILGIDCGPARAPNPSVSENELSAMKADLEAIGFFGCQ